MDPNRLTAIPIFSELSPEEARRLATFATETSVAEGQILMKQGDYSTELIAIEEGTADVIRDGKKIASLKEGDLIGEMGLIERRPRNADVIATSPMRVLKLTHWEIRRMSQETVDRIQKTIEERRSAGVADPAEPDGRVAQGRAAAPDVKFLQLSGCQPVQSRSPGGAIRLLAPSRGVGWLVCASYRSIRRRARRRLACAGGALGGRVRRWFGRPPGRSASSHHSCRGGSGSSTAARSSGGSALIPEHSPRGTGAGAELLGILADSAGRRYGALTSRSSRPG